MEQTTKIGGDLRVGIWLMLISILVCFFLTDVFLGSVSMPINEALLALIKSENSNPIFVNILYKIRLPKAVTAILVGAALAVSGLQLQTLFRNPLAGPSVLGITAGASLGVAFLVLSGGSVVAIYTVNQLGLGGSWILAIFSSLGALFVLLIIVGVSFRIRNNVVLLIIGLMIGNITIAIVGIWQYFSSPELIKDFLMWTFGSLGGVTNHHLIVLSLIVFTGLFLAFLLIKPLNMLLLGEHYAKSMGLNTKQVRVAIILITSLLTGVVTGFCGPIGFIGIAVPHLTRAMFKFADHRILMPASALLGSVVLLGCDIIAQLPGVSLVLPINTVTALLGSPVVIWVIMKRRKLSFDQNQSIKQLPELLAEDELAVGNKHQIQVKQLAIGYGKKLLFKDLNLNLHVGQVVALLGPNGVGKTTLINTLTGYQKPCSGQVFLDGNTIQSYNEKALAQLRSVVLTDREFFGDLTVYSLVAMGRYPHTGWFGNLRNQDQQKIYQGIRCCRHVAICSTSFRYIE